MKNHNKNFIKVVYKCGKVIEKEYPSEVISVNFKIEDPRDMIEYHVNNEVSYFKDGVPHSLKHKALTRDWSEEGWKAGYYIEGVKMSKKVWDAKRKEIRHLKLIH